jgi:antitoxin YefM
VSSQYDFRVLNSIWLRQQACIREAALKFDDPRIACLPVSSAFADFDVSALSVGLDIGVPVSYRFTYGIGGAEMTTLTASEARKRLYTLVDDVAESHEAVQIVGKRKTAILVSEEDWNAIQETLYLTSVPGMRESIREGLNTPVDECDEELDW